jgi:hypothetical protein
MKKYHVEQSLSQVARCCPKCCLPLRQDTDRYFFCYDCRKVFELIDTMPEPVNYEIVTSPGRGAAGAGAVALGGVPVRTKGGRSTGPKDGRPYKRTPWQSAKVS